MTKNFVDVRSETLDKLKGISSKIDALVEICQEEWRGNSSRIGSFIIYNISILTGILVITKPFEKELRWISVPFQRDIFLERVKSHVDENYSKEEAEDILKDIC